MTAAVLPVASLTGAWDPQALIGLGLLALGALVALLLQRLLGAVRAQREALAQLERLEAIQAALARLSEARGGADLRRLEHALIDIRDGQRRLEERILATLDARRERGPDAIASAPASSGGAELSERLVTRLLAMGCERIRLLASGDELDALAAQGGEVAIEARREGAVCKGRATVREGAIVDVDLRSAHQMFP